ncbi:outer membrane protein assembly factor BamA [Thiorhodospira sibirica]|uniref:outer membrane protein assembly factor BamA n=1 Tax=Thiorhodospira sibirica TaxID=154347 RepID=UPI00022C33D5
MRTVLMLLCLLGVALLPVAQAADFVIDDIEVEGLQRIAPGTVFTYLPVRVGDRFEATRSAEIVRVLFRTGFFSDVSLQRRDNILIVRVVERPAINEIRISGNRDIKTEQLTDALRQVGIARGRVFNRTALERMESELLQQYFARGKYNVNVEVAVEDLPRNRVDIVIDINEGQVARIQRVNIVGNQAFSNDALLRRFSSGVPPWYAFFSRRDHYSKQKLAGDLEALRSRYLDEGFVNFTIDSTQVTLTPDRRDLYITININEGERYTISDVRLAGELVVEASELQELLEVSPGDTFSRARITASIEALTRRLGNEGYAFASVNPIPEVDDERRRIELTFFVDPGQRVYVRRINFSGNQRTRDEVFRREMRQMEGGWYSASAIERSRVRLQRLSFVESVDLQTRRVPGLSDQVDLDIAITERLSGSFVVGAGYAQSQGALFNMSLSQENFFGTGNRVSLAFNNSRINRIYSLSYTNPYYTLDGVSRGFNLYYRETDASRAEISRYSSNRLGADLSYGIPLTEYDSLRFTPGFERIEILTSERTPGEILDFLDQHGRTFNIYSLNAAFAHDTRNRIVFPDYGNLQRVVLESAVPGSDLEYYKASYQHQHYFQLRPALTLGMTGEVGYGKHYGDTSELPFFEKYFAGGTRSVRGYKDYSLGPRDSNNDPFGGDFRVIGGAELFFPPPFMDESPNLRMSFFLDAGQVFAGYDDFAADDIRASTGVGLSWLSPVGALTFSMAHALNDKPQDRLQAFQFTIGASF